MPGGPWSVLVLWCVVLLYVALPCVVLFRAVLPGGRAVAGPPPT
ncbi:hypothetical protein [Streptomyces sp. NPDC059788]